MRVGVAAPLRGYTIPGGLHKIPAGGLESLVACGDPVPQRNVSMIWFFFGSGLG